MSNCAGGQGAAELHADSWQAFWRQRSRVRQLAAVRGQAVWRILAPTRSSRKDVSPTAPGFHTERLHVNPLSLETPLRACVSLQVCSSACACVPLSFRICLLESFHARHSWLSIPCLIQYCVGAVLAVMSGRYGFSQSPVYFSSVCNDRPVHPH